MRVHVLVLAALAVFAPVAAHAADAESYIFRGTVGPYRVGAMLRVEGDHRTVSQAHYFYTTKLADIALSASGDRDTVILREPGGGTFRLHFFGNGSNHGDPLNFYNSVGLEGTWTNGARTFPVKLGLEGSGGEPGRWYAMVTKESDAAFEATARRFLHGATTGNIAETASATHFPLRVNAAKPYDVTSPAQLKARWASIFTPAYVARLKLAVPHDMFVHEGEAMVGSGEVWFDDKGATSLNPVAPSH